MKLNLFFSGLLLCTVLCIRMLYSTDEMPYVVSPYDDARDHQEAFALVTSHLHELVRQKEESDVVRLSKKYNATLQNNRPMCSLYTPVEDSYNRLVLRDKDQLVGFADFYLVSDNVDAVKKRGWLYRNYSL
jgi:hypothetical protein